MSIQYHEVVRAGGGRLEYIAAPAGIPWGVGTSQEICTLAAASTTIMRSMFGGVVSAAVFPADTVPLFPVMEYPGRQILKLTGDQGMLDGGDFDIEILREPTGHTWTHRSGEIWGLEGVHTLPDPRFDTTIGSARLSRSFKKGDTFLYLKEDVGEKIFDKVTATGNYELIWIGNECVLATAVTDAAAELEDGEIRLTVIRAALCSKEQSVFIEDYDGTNVRVCDAPIGGVAGKPIRVWGFIVSEDGNEILDGPVKARHGRCTTNVTSQGGASRIKCLAWHENLNSTLQAKGIQATMDKYVLSRPSSSYSADDHDCCGHLVIREAASDINHIWFCEPGHRVVFDTYEDLVAFVNTELSACQDGTPSITGNPTLGTGAPYVITNMGFTLDGYTGDPGILISGPLPWLLGWGAWHTDSIADIREALTKRNMGHFASYYITELSPTLTNDQIAASTLGQHWMSSLNALGNPHEAYTWWPPTYCRSPYLLQYDWANDPGAVYIEGDVGDYPHMYSFPVPLDEDDSNKPKIYVKSDQDATSYDSNVEIRIGQEGRRFNDRPVQLKAQVQETGDNWIRAANPYEFEAFSSSAAAIWTVDEERAPLTKGFVFYYIPYLDDKEEWNEGDVGDPWPISQVMEFMTDDPVKLLKALLGDTTDITLPENFVFDHIPDALDETASGYYDQTSSFDFDSLEAMLHPIFDGQIYKIIVGPETTYMDLLRQVLLFHGVSPTWDYRISFGYGQYAMGWRPIGVVSASEAQIAGRTIEEDDRVDKDVPTEVHSLQNEYSRIEAKCNYDGKKFQGEINTEDKTGYAVTGGKSATLTIKDRLSYIEGIEQIETNPLLNEQVKQHFSSAVLAKLALPAPVIRVKLKLNKQLDLALGRECLITDPELHNPFTGAKGLNDQPAVVTSFGYDLGRKDGVCEATINLTPNAVYDWAPAMRVAGGNSTRDVVGVAGETSITPDTGLFNHPDDPDELFFFDCYTYNPSTEEIVAKSCSCTDYAVYAFLEGEETAPKLNFTIGDVDLTAGTAVLYGDNTTWDTTKDYIIKFQPFNAAGLQECQRNWLVYADDENKIVDSGAVEYPGREWA